MLLDQVVVDLAKPVEGKIRAQRCQFDRSTVQGIDPRKE